MPFNIFEGFKRLNQAILLAILITGIVISYNQNPQITTYVNLEVGSICNINTESYKEFENGNVKVVYCFKDTNHYENFSEMIDSHEWSEVELKKIKYDLRYEWIKILFQGIGVTLLIAISYFLFCKVIKYIAIGFIKK